jgi:putative addiction module component (TIGR02574 family)
MQLHELSQLSVQDRLQAMELLWQSFIDTDYEHANLIPAWHQQVISERLARIKAGLENTNSWQEVSSRLREATKKSDT